MSGKAPHLVHGMGTALEVPTWPAITMVEAEAILARFPAAGRLAALRWHSPRPFSAATLVETDEGDFLLKRHHCLLRTPAALAEEHAFMAHLLAAGLTVPEIVNARDGTGSVAQGEWTYELHRKAPGIDLYRDRPSWTPFLTPGHAFQAGVALARLHLAAQGFAAPARAPHPLVASFTILPAHDPLAAAADYVAARPALAEFLTDKPWREELARLFASLAGRLSERLVGQPSLWTHNDWHPSNLLWSSDGAVSTIFDFGLATRTCALHDIATAIERTAVPWLELDSEPADAEAALALLSGYRTVIPLAPADVETVLRLLPLAHIEFALSEVDYFAGILADREQATLAWQGYLIDHAAWFLSRAGQEFLRQVEIGTRA
ncbi:aminoglycoside phosphotransferase [Novosphingobium sp. Rr 2-17]|uniref:phosphotransferase enzyme family protein n=1 Tax=Novosphingobium sp. Rr 2-17 TaxID=555793 RepID=UPI000269818D|nr:phosphotransferase [Novosphingobium sp. Rr 2-17]EIZ80780.1 aminoglycoside phosphotransferase [Novosphingobium sp. Rr 2-17]